MTVETDDHQKIKNLYNADSPLDKRQVLTYADFVSNKEADVEDMFEPDFYLSLLNNGFGTVPLTITDIAVGHPCIIRASQRTF